MLKIKKLKIFLLIINIFLTLNTQIEENKTSDADDEIGKSVLVQCPFSNMTEEMILKYADKEDDLFYGSICVRLADILNNQKLTEEEKNNSIDNVFLDYYKKTYWSGNNNDKMFFFDEEDYFNHFHKYKCNTESMMFFFKIYNDFKDRRHKKEINRYYCKFFKKNGNKKNDNYKMSDF